LRESDGEEHEILLEAKRDPQGRLSGLTDTFIRVVVVTDRPAGSWVRVRLCWTGDPRQMAGEILP
jgi:hypothetical protein